MSEGLSESHCRIGIEAADAVILAVTVACLSRCVGVDGHDNGRHVPASVLSYQILNIDLHFSGYADLLGTCQVILAVMHHYSVYMSAVGAVVHIYCSTEVVNADFRMETACGAVVDDVVIGFVASDLYDFHENSSCLGMA